MRGCPLDNGNNWRVYGPVMRKCEDSHDSTRRSVRSTGTPGLNIAQEPSTSTSGGDIMGLMFTSHPRMRAGPTLPHDCVHKVLNLYVRAENRV